MTALKTLLLVLHISGGMLGLITGMINMINRKGGKLHKLIGKLYVTGMFVATISGMFLAFIGENQFLFLIGVFSFYLAFSGYRTLSHRKPDDYRFVDKSVAFLTGVFAMVMIVTGVFNFSTGNLVINPVLLIFGVVCLIYGWGDLLIFIGKRETKHPKYHWFFNHIVRMIASYISAVTAFLVVNLTVGPPLLIWLGPSVLGSVAITLFIRKYKRKFRLNA